MNNGVILDTHNTKIKLKRAPPSRSPKPHVPTSVEEGQRFQVEHGAAPISGAGLAGESTPAPTTLLPFCFLASLLVFVSYRKMFLPFRHH